MLQKEYLQRNMGKFSDLSQWAYCRIGDTHTPHPNPIHHHGCRAPQHMRSKLLRRSQNKIIRIHRVLFKPLFKTRLLLSNKYVYWFATFLNERRIDKWRVIRYKTVSFVRVGKNIFVFPQELFCENSRERKKNAAARGPRKINQLLKYRVKHVEMWYI